MHNSSRYANVKGDYLIQLAREWYRIDTNRGRIDALVARQAGRRRSGAKSAATGSRPRTSWHSTPSTITSQGRGRVL